MITLVYTGSLSMMPNLRASEKEAFRAEIVIPSRLAKSFPLFATTPCSIGGFLFALKKNSDRHEKS